MPRLLWRTCSSARATPTLYTRFFSDWADAAAFFLQCSRDWIQPFSADLRKILTGLEIARPSGAKSLSSGEVAIGQTLPQCSDERILGGLRTKGAIDWQNKHRTKQSARQSRSALSAQRRSRRCYSWPRNFRIVNSTAASCACFLESGARPCRRSRTPPTRRFRLENARYSGSTDGLPSIQDSSNNDRLGGCICQKGFAKALRSPVCLPRL